MRKPVLTFALAGCLFLLIVGAKWATFGSYGSPMPDWDQWDAEAVELFIPWFDNDHFLKHLFHPHNEHRIILTKLQNLGLVLLNGQWDSRLEAVTNAMLHAALAVAFWMLGRRCLAPRWHALLFVLIAALFGLPLAWQNVLGGFHSQQYWLLGLSFVAIVLLPFARSWGASWWIGVVSALLAVGSMGSGFLAAAVVVMVVVWRLLRRQTTLGSAWPALVFMTAIVVGGMLTRVEVDWHQNLKAKTVHDFFFSIVHSLQWPLRDADWAAAVLWLPWLLVVWRVVRIPAAAPAPHLQSEVGCSEREFAQLVSTRVDQSLAALGGWVVIQIVATAYARGVGADYPASRYMDTLAFGATVNAVAMGWWLTVGQRTLPARILRYALGLAWLVTLGLGLREISLLNFRHELPNAKKYYIKAEGNMRRYLATNDPKQLARPDIPFPSADGLVERLGHPSIRKLMPVPIRAALPMMRDASTESIGFHENNAVAADWENNLPRLGLSPQMAPLDDTSSWGSFTAVEKEPQQQKKWKSAPLTAPLGGWLKFETAGDLGAKEGGVRLQLQDATGATLAEVAPSRLAGDSWRAAYVRAPRGPFIVVATDVSAREWLAFGPPVELASLSYWAWQATRHGKLVFGFAAAATIVLVGWGIFAGRQKRLAARAPGCS